METSTAVVATLNDAPGNAGNAEAGASWHGGFRIRSFLLFIDRGSYQ
jgi:hypothetical protein